MGTWDYGNFDNDGAMDFIGFFTEQDSLTPVETAFDAILAVEDYIDADYGVEAIAAAEVVALLRGHPSASVPDGLTTWHQSHQLTVNDALTTKAIQAVQKAADSDQSELRELWEDAEFEEWYPHITDLLTRLRA